MLSHVKLCQGSQCIFFILLCARRWALTVGLFDMWLLLLKVVIIIFVACCCCCLCGMLLSVLWCKKFSNKQATEPGADTRQQDRHHAPTTSPDLEICWAGVLGAHSFRSKDFSAKTNWPQRSQEHPFCWCSRSCLLLSGSKLANLTNEQTNISFRQHSRLPPQTKTRRRLKWSRTDDRGAQRADRRAEFAWQRRDHGAAADASGGGGQRRREGHGWPRGVCWGS